MNRQVKAEITDFIRGRRAQAVATLAELVRAPSDNPPGDCAPHAEVAARQLADLGFTVEKHPVPADLVRRAGMISATNLIVRERFGDGPVVALNAHGDVVPPGDGWTADPYGAEIRDGWMYGRGVATSKSDFVTFALALLALKKLGASPGGTVELHFTYDEETGGEIGPKWLLAQGLTQPDYAICAGFTYNVVPAHSGCLHLEVELVGRSAHAARPDTGRDPLEAATAILGDLYAERRRYAAVRSSVSGIGGPTLVVGLISGGINTNVVPDRVSFRLDRRVIPEEQPDLVEAALTGFIRTSAARWPDVVCNIRRILSAAPLVPGPGHKRLVRAIQGAAREVLGEDITAQGVPIYTDARHYSAAGIPTVLYGAGPRSMVEANAHRADERLNLDDLEKAAQVVALAVLDLLKTPAGPADADGPGAPGSR